MRRRSNVHATLAAISLAAFGWLLAAVINGSTLPVDEHIRAQIHGMAVGPLTAAMRLITFFGSAIWVLTFTAFAVLLLKKDGRSRAAATLAVVIAGGYPIENALKFIVHRARPEAFFNAISPPTYSFPSGHALLSTALYGTLGYIASQAATTNVQRAFVWFATAISIVLISFSRVYLGVHYPSDIAGGFLIACFWLNAVLAFAKLR
jgi:undecaprenyl-diphosphatase